MKIKRLILYNFKSYKSLVISELDEHCNIIIGKNGHGKSNIHIALLFLFSDLYSSETPQAKREALHESLPIESELYVEAMIDNTEKSLLIDAEEVLVRKTLDAHNRVVIKVNDRVLSQKEYYSLLEVAGMRRHDPSNFLLQGKVRRVAQADERTLYSLLTDAIGTQSYEEKKAESLEVMNSIGIDERKALELLDEFREKLSDLEVDKEDFEKYEENLKAGNRIYHVLYKRKIEKKQLRAKEIEKLLEEKRTTILDAKKKENQLSETLRADNLTIQQKESELETIEKDIAELSNQTRQYQYSLQKCQAQIDEDLASQLATQHEVKSQLAKLEHDKVTKQSKKQSLVQDIQKLQAAYDSKKIIYEQYVMLKNNSSDPKKMKKVLQEKTEGLEGLIQARQEAINTTKKETDRLQKELKEKESHVHQLRREAEEANEKMIALMGTIQEAEKEREKAATEGLKLKYSLASSKEALSAIQSKIAEKRTQLELSAGESNIGSTLRLLEQIEKAGVEGVYGLFADMIEFDESLSFGIEQLARNKLYSIVVRDEPVSEEVIRLNKEIRGGKVQIYPLSWVTDKRQREYPDDNRVIILEDHVKPKPRFSELGVENLISDILGGNLLVEKLEEAQRLAKSYDCNCATMEGEVVFAGGFLTQLGYVQRQEEKLTTFTAFRKLYESMQASKKVLERSTNQVQELKNKELINGTVAAEARMQKEKERLNEENLRAECSSWEKAAIQIRKMIIELEQRNNIDLADQKQFESELQRFKQSESQGGLKVDSFSEDKFKEAEKAMLANGQKLKKATEELDNLTASLNLLESDVERLQISMHANEHKTNEAYKIEQDMLELEAKRLKELIDNLNDYRNKRDANKTSLKKEIDKLSANVSKVEEELRKHKLKQEESQLQLQQVNQNRFDLQINLDGFQTKLAVLNVDEDTEGKELKALSRVSDKDLIGKLKDLMLNKLKYTDKDKVNFQRLEDYFKYHNEYKAEINDLKESKKTFYDIVENIDEKVEEINQSMFKEFKTHFTKIFGKLVPTGSASIEFVDNVKVPKAGQTQQNDVGKGIRINTSFDVGSRGMPLSGTTDKDGHLMNLSPGQKTVIAVCIVMALQKCNPSPFYCFDEIDADLDVAAVRLLSKLVREISASSQVFMTTFRPEAIDISPSKIFRVHMGSSSSEATLTDYNTAREFLDRRN